MNSWKITLLILSVCIGSAIISAQAFVPFVIPAKQDPNSEIRFPYAPITEQDRLSAKEHFQSSKERVRLWGVNFTFEANFPTHADAEQIAQRLACAGINSVRMHHMDTMPWPRGIWNSDGKTLCPEALDRLDYFIDQLARHGIYTNLNLHVGKEYSKTLGLPDSPENYNKMISLFTPQIIEEQKNYARQLLTHKNQYRSFTYADDPAIAIVEITNENSLFMWSADRVLPALPKFYADILQQKYNLWLKSKYGTTEKLAAAWSAGSIPLGPNILLNSDFKTQSPDKSAPDKWQLEQHETAKFKTVITTYEGQTALRIEPLHIDGIDWHLQLNQINLNVEKGRIYTVTARIAADIERPVVMSLIQTDSPWKSLGLYQSLTLGPKWKQIQFVFTAAESETNARFNVVFGKSDVPIYLAEIALHPGAVYKINTTEWLEQNTVQVFGDAESKARQLDRMMFFAETEKQFFDDMRNFLKKDLGCKAMITGTIVFGPLGLYAQSDMDFIDAHAYWQHPWFPRKSWDSADWLIEQKAMTDYPEQSTLVELAAQRLAGKPYTVTEYNHPAPLDSQAQCVPMIASFAAAQDWDGVWLYTYSHSNNNWNRDFLNSYFDIDTNPAKWGFVPAGAAMFRFNRMNRFQSEQGFFTKLIKPDVLEYAADLHLNYNGSLLHFLQDQWRQIAPNRTLSDLFTHEIQTVILSLSQIYGRSVSPTQYTKIDWNTLDTKIGGYCAESAGTMALAGSSDSFTKTTNGLIQITSPAQTSITITPLDNKRASQSSKILITTCGRCENTDMKFSDNRRTVGTNWGKGPVQIESIDGTIDLSKILKEMDKVKVFTLNPNGTKKIEVPIKDGKIELLSKYATMWYLIEK